MNKFIRVASGQRSAKQMLSKLDYKQNIQAIIYFKNINSLTYMIVKQRYKEHLKCTRWVKITRPVAVQLQVGVKNQIKVERTHAFNHFPSVVYSFRKPHTTPRTIPDRSAKLLYIQRLLRTSCCRTAMMLF